MTKLLEKDTLFHFSKECMTYFSVLKEKLTKAPIMVPPDWNLPFELMCDASDQALGAFWDNGETTIFSLYTMQAARSPKLMEKNF